MKPFSLNGRRSHPRDRRHMDPKRDFRHFRRIDTDEYALSPSTGWRSTYAIMVGDRRGDP